MLVKLLRRLTLEEIERRIRILERIYGMRFDEFEELFLSGNLNERLVDEYFKWSQLVDAYRGYEEDGEVECVVEEMRDLNPKELKVMTPKRLELLYTISSSRTESINDLSRKIRRNVKNVYHDLQVLKKLGFIDLKRKGRRNFVPEALVEEITFFI